MLGFLYFDPLYLIMAAPGLLLALYASTKTKSTFQKYAKVAASSRLTGAQAARHMLDSEGLQDVQIERVQGFLSDHYDPRARVLRLSPPVFDSPSLSSVGVACHEAGHALQHAHGYAPLALRSALVPATMISSQGAYWVFLIGIFMSQTGNLFGGQLINIALVMFAVSVLFSLVTLPVEWDASARAKHQMVAAGIITPQEQPQAAAVLNAAFLTYVASAVTAIMTFVYFFLRARDD
jgi:Zn-dependent membrane protease YugP